MQKNCKQCAQPFEITDEDLAFYDKVSPVFAGKKYLIPPPTLCPDCRQQRRLAFRNERKLYQRKCDMTGKEILSIYAPDSPFKVYDQDIWWSDKWDPMSYGREFDSTKSISEQLRALYRDVPHVSLYNTNVENSYYTNYALNQKNCYLIFGSGNAEDCMYGKFIVNCKDTVDSLTVYDCELCYKGIASDKCYGCRFFVNCRSCTGCTMIEDCSSCSDCIGCFGLRTKQYCIFNKQYSREEFEKLKEQYEYLTPEKIKILRQRLDELKMALPHVQSHIYASEDSSGESIYNCKNCKNSFDAKESEDCKYIYFAPKTIHTQDCTFCAPDGARFCYNICSTVDIESSMANFYIWTGSNIYYSLECHHNTDLFACVGLRNKKYCILNKQYSKEEYGKMVAKIIEQMQRAGEWGEYFPYENSPFAYNETIAQEYYPLTKDQALKIGGKWRDENPDTILAADAYKPPADIRDVNDDICNEVLRCQTTGRRYKIIPKELNFYRKMKLPVPEVCPDQRHYNRLQNHKSFKLWDRKCANCGAPIQTTFAPGRPETVYCEKCYLKAVY